MTKTLRFPIVAILLLTFASGSAYAERGFVPSTMSPHIDVAQMGMGGLTTTIATNAHTIFYNPGMLKKQKFALELANIQLGFDSDISDMVTFISDHSEDFSTFDSLSLEDQQSFIEDSQEFDNKWMGLNVGPFIGLSFKHFGIAAYGNVNGGFKLDQGVVLPAIGVRGYADVVFGVGYGQGFNIAGQEWDLGMTVRYLQRRAVEPKRVSASDAGAIEDLGQVLVDELEDPKTGLGIDLGGAKTIELGEPGSGREIDLGIAVQDLYGTYDGNWIKPNLKVGVMYHVPFAGGALLKRWDFGIEKIDLLNRDGVAFFQGVNMGTEMNLLAGLLKLRAGFHQGYPTYGLGVRLLLIKIDVAMFTRELGVAPGQVQDDLLMAQVSIGF